MGGGALFGLVCWSWCPFQGGLLELFSGWFVGVGALFTWVSWELVPFSCWPKGDQGKHATLPSPYFKTHAPFGRPTETQKQNYLDPTILEHGEKRTDQLLGIKVGQFLKITRAKWCFKEFPTKVTCENHPNVHLQQPTADCPQSARTCLVELDLDPLNLLLDLQHV